ncbi:MAG: hypothetical protein QXG17_06365 [Sulfolobales archaeon]
MLQKAVDIVWENRFPQLSKRRGKISVKVGYKVKVPRVPADGKFKKMLRYIPLAECPYAKYWVDGVIRTA